MTIYQAEPLYSTTEPLKAEPTFIVITDGDRWRCVRCGACCKCDFDDDWLNFVGSINDEASGAEVCLYLDLTSSRPHCRNYEGRPNACRAFPFSLRKQENGRYKLVIHSKCPGFGQGRLINIEQKIRQCLRHSNREFHRRMRFDFSSFDFNRDVALVR